MSGINPRDEGLLPEFEAPLGMQWPIWRSPGPIRKSLSTRFVEYWEGFDPIDAAETLLRHLRSIRDLVR